MWRRTALFLFLMIGLCLTLASCEVVGYDNPVASGGFAWEHISGVDPLTGESMQTVRTRASSNSFFGRVMSIFGGRPSFSLVCLSGSALEYRVDWREAVGPPASARRVDVSLDGDAPYRDNWDIAQSGRQSAISSGSASFRAGLG